MEPFVCRDGFPTRSATSCGVWVFVGFGGADMKNLSCTVWKARCLRRCSIGVMRVLEGFDAPKSPTKVTFGGHHEVVHTLMLVAISRRRKTYYILSSSALFYSLTWDGCWEEEELYNHLGACPLSVIL